MQVSQLTLQHHTNRQLHGTLLYDTLVSKERPQHKLSQLSWPCEVLLHVRPNVPTIPRELFGLQKFSDRLKYTSFPLILLRNFSHFFFMRVEDFTFGYSSWLVLFQRVRVGFSYSLQSSLSIFSSVKGTLQMHIFRQQFSTSNETHSHFRYTLLRTSYRRENICNDFIVKIFGKSVRYGT